MSGGFELMQCRVCGAPWSDDRGPRVECAHCGAVYRRQDTAVPSRAAAPIPAWLHVDRSGGALTLSSTWRKSMVGCSAPFLVLFAAAWFGGLWVLGTSGWMADSGTSGFARLIVLGGAGVVGLGLIYVVLAVLANTTHIALTDGVLTLRHGPLPWPGALEVKASRVAQIYARRVQGARDEDGRRSAASYSLHFIDTDGVSRPLFRALRTLEDAIFLEQILEDGIGLVDAAVPGEAGRP